MIRHHDLDCGDAYASVRVELMALVADASTAERARPVPATPGWTVLDVLAHVVGLTADLNHGRIPVPGDDPDAWTDRQVADRRGRSLDALVAEWDHEAPAFEEGLRAFGYEVGCHLLADLVQHRIDVAQALGRPGPVPSEALTAGVDWYLDVAHGRLAEAGRGGVAVRIDGDEIQVGPEPVLATVELTALEALRALGGRRSLRQLAALGWAGDPAPVLELLSAYPPPSDDLDEGTSAV